MGAPCAGHCTPRSGLNDTSAPAAPLMALMAWDDGGRSSQAAGKAPRGWPPTRSSDLTQVRVLCSQLGGLGVIKDVSGPQFYSSIDNWV